MHFHTYFDGDILIIVENIPFRLHKNILCLASNVFKDMFDHASSQNQFEIEQEIAYDFNNLLTFIYPGKYVPITWDNVEGLLRISDKFDVESGVMACENFLSDNYQKKLMLTFALADRFNFKNLYKESSKLILNDYQKLKDHTFEKLSENAKASLNERYINFFFGLCSIVKNPIHSTLNDYTHKCKNAAHCKILEDEWNKRVKDLKLIPPPSPSTIYKRMFAKIDGIQNRKCNDHFINRYLPEKINNLLGGNFERLDGDIENDIFGLNQKYYIYVEK